MKPISVLIKLCPMCTTQSPVLAVYKPVVTSELWIPSCAISALTPHYACFIQFWQWPKNCHFDTLGFNWEKHICVVCVSFVDLSQAGSWVVSGGFSPSSSFRLTQLTWQPSSPWSGWSPLSRVLKTWPNRLRLPMVHLMLAQPKSSLW